MLEPPAAFGNAGIKYLEIGQMGDGVQVRLLTPLIAPSRLFNY
jgi:hypothetical protein